MPGAETVVDKEICLDRVFLRPLSEVPNNFLDICARIYFNAWTNEGIPLDFDRTVAKIPLFDPETSYCLIDEDSGLPIAVIHTVLVHARSPFELIEQFPCYSSVEGRSLDRHHPRQPNIRLCFSITALPCHKVRWQSKFVSPSLFIMKNLPNADLHAIAYSRYSQIGSSPDLFAHYLANQETSKNLGPVGMHEYFGGLTIAFIEGSRPEDIRGGQGNVLVVYPASPEEALRFQQIKARRRLEPPTYQEVGPFTFFTDYSLDKLLT